MNINALLRKRIFIIILFFLIVLKSYCQTSTIISYVDLTPMLDLVKNHECCIVCGFRDEENLLRQNVLSLNWKLDSNETFESLYQEMKNEKTDYRYFLIIAKATSSHYRQTNDYDNDSSYNIIEYYYKSLFLNLAIEQGTNLPIVYKDSLKYEYTRQYLFSKLHDYCFPSYSEFKDFAELNIEYSQYILNDIRFSLPKDERSELYWTIADAIYSTKYTEEKDEQSLSEVFRYLSLAIKENPNNWRAVSDRAEYYKTNLSNYKAAISDYLLWLKIVEAENNELIRSEMNRLAMLKIKKSKPELISLSPTFTVMIDGIVECYLGLNDYKNVLLWCNKAENAVKKYQLHNINSDELSSKYRGAIYYYKSIANYNLNNQTLACKEIDSAVNFGISMQQYQEMKSKINCDNVNDNNISSSITMIEKHGVYEIPVTLNDVLKINFLFDAGASDVSISPDVALTLIKTGTVTNEDFIGTETYQFADGSTAKSKVFIIKKIQLGNKEVYNIKASISNSIDAPLLLGQSVLNKFGKVIIDYKKGAIIFED